MKTVKLKEEEVELLIAIYEDELKEAEIYMDKLAQTLGKLKKQAEHAGAEPSVTGKKRGRKPKQKAEVQKPSKPGKKRGRKKRVQSAPGPEPVKPAAKKAPRKKRTRKARKPAAPKPVKVEAPVVAVG